MRVHGGKAQKDGYKSTLADRIIIEFRDDPLFIMPKVETPIAGSGDAPLPALLQIVNPSDMRWPVDGAWMSISAYDFVDLDENLVSRLDGSDPNAANLVWEQIPPTTWHVLRSEAQVAAGVAATFAEPAVVLQTFSVHDVVEATPEHHITQSPLLITRQLGVTAITEQMMDSLSNMMGVIAFAQIKDPDKSQVKAIANAARCYYRGVQLPFTSVDFFLTVYVVLESLSALADQRVSTGEAAAIASIETLFRSHPDYNAATWSILKNRMSRISISEKFSRVIAGPNTAQVARDTAVFDALRRIRNELAHGVISAVPPRISVQGNETDTIVALRELTHRCLSIVLGQVRTAVTNSGYTSSLVSVK
jgi:hypothetical protein